MAAASVVIVVVYSAHHNVALSYCIPSRYVLFIVQFLCHVLCVKSICHVRILCHVTYMYGTVQYSTLLTSIIVLYSTQYFTFSERN